MHYTTYAVFCLKDLVYKVSRKKQIQTTTVVLLLLLLLAAANEQDRTPLGN